MSLINEVLQDLEKRHASEADFNALPPNVRAVQERRRSPIRIYVIGAIVLLALAASLWFALSNRFPSQDNGQQAVPKPVAVVPSPAPLPKEPVVQPAAPAPERAVVPAPAPAAPASRLSADLTIPSRSAKAGKSATVAREAIPQAARPSVEVVPPALPQVEKPPAPRIDVATRIDTPPRPASVPNEPAEPPVVAPIPRADPPVTTKSAVSTVGAIDKQMREVAPAELAEIAFRKGVTQLQDGRANAAEADFRDALKLDPSHGGARQALLGLLLDGKRNNEAEQLLRKALEFNPRQPRYAMVLARLEVERGEVAGAVNSMVAALPYVQSDPDFYAFLAALLQREGRHRESIDYYRAALRGVPGNGVWMMGMGISLRAANQAAEARDTFQRALDSRQLTPDLREFVDRQLRELSATKK